MDDYGKMAYFECEQLKQRIAKLENQAKTDSYAEIEFFESDDEQRTLFEKSFEFNSLKSATLNFSVDGVIDNSYSRAEIIVYANGIKLKSIYISSENFSFSLSYNAPMGLNVIKIEVLYYIAFSLTNLHLSIRGTIEYLGINTKIEHTIFSGNDVVMFFCDNKVELCSYSNSALSLRYSKPCVDACISVYNTQLLLLTIDESGNLTATLFDSDFQNLIESQIDTKVNNVCGAKSIGAFICYAIKGCRVYKCEISVENQAINLMKNQLDYQAVKIVSSFDVENVYILTDFNGNSKLVEEN